jgi:hypothetical protein
MKRIFTIGLLTLIGTFCSAQKKGSTNVDPWFEEFNREPFQQGRDGTLLIEIKNTGKDVDDCVLKAKQQAVFAVIFTGYTEANNIPAAPALSPTDIALYHEKVNFFQEFFNNTSQYGVYVPKAALNPKRPVSKLDKKTVQAYTIVTVEVDRLRKQLEAQEIIKSVVDFGFKPTVLVVPSDTWMERNKYVNRVDNQGMTEKIYDYENAINNESIKNALNVVKEKLGGPSGSFQVQDIPQRMGDFKMEVAKNNARSLAKRESNLDIFARTMQADLWVKVDFQTNKLKSGLETQFLMTISGTDPYTGNEVLPGKQIDKVTVGDNMFQLTKNAMGGAVDDFRPKLFEYFKKVTSEGLQGRLSIGFSDNVEEDFNTKFPYKGKDYELSRIVDAFLKRYAERSEPEGTQTEKMRKYSVNIPLEYMDELTEEKEKNSFENFSRQFRDELEKLGLSSVTENNGLGKVEVIITEVNR